MGCESSGTTSSSPRVSPAKSSQIANSSKTGGKNDGTDNSHNTKREIIHPCQSMFQDLKKVMGGVTKLPRPNIVSFVSCLSNDSLPLAISPISYEEGEPSNINLPTIGIARCEKGRIICFGNIEILTDCKPENAEYLAFMENILQFASGPRPSSSAVLFLGLDPQDSEMLQHNMTGLGFVFDRSTTEPSDLSKFSVVFAMSDCIFGDEIFEFIKNGGGFFCFACLEPGEYKYQMNKTLVKCGIAFPAKIAELPQTKKASMRTTVRASELERATFPFLVNDYKDILVQNETTVPDPVEMSTAVTYLMIHAQCFEREHNDFFIDIFKSSMIFLEKTKFRQPDGLFHLDCQRIVAALLSDVLSKFPPEDFANCLSDIGGDIELCEPFPGKCVPSDLCDQTDIKVTIQSVNWHSTGLWLPANIISEVTVDPPNLADVSIQVGSHSEPLLDSPGPWKRWPVVTQTYQLGEKNNIRIASPFGGLLYVVNHKQRKPQRIKLTLTNVMKAIYITDNDKPETTSISPKMFIPPYGEIQTKYICFTLPSADIKNNITNIGSFITFIDNLVNEVMLFAGYKPKRQFRIVFDIDIPETGSVSSYPLMMQQEMLEGIFLNEEPSSELFAALMMIGIVSMPEGSLDPNVEAAFGALAAAHAFLKVWPSSSPNDYTYIHLSPMFSSLWEIYTNNDPKLIATALSHFHQAQLVEVTPHEQSISYIVNEMSLIADKDFSSLLESALTLANLSSQRFPSYKCLMEEEEQAE